MDNPLPTVTADLSAEDFPLTIRLIDQDTEQVVFTTEVTGPGAIRIPGLNETGARAVDVELIYPNGRRHRYSNEID